MKLTKKKKGFTIVELVIVIGVIGILAGILIPTFVNVNQKAEEAALKSNLANAYSAYIADAADGLIDDNKVVTDPATDTKYYLVTLKQEDVILQNENGAYQFVADQGWSTEKVAGFDATNKDIVLNKAAVNPVPADYTGKTVTYGGFKVWSKVAHAVA